LRPSPRREGLSGPTAKITAVATFTAWEQFMSESAAAAVAYDRSPTGRHPVLKAVNSTWDDVPTGPVPASVIQYFEDAIAREEARRNARSPRNTN
jgi:hypothetical protein